MNCQLEEFIYVGNDNSFTDEFKLDFDLYDFTNTTKIVFTLNAKSVDSVTNPAYFDFSTGTDGRVEFKMGGAGFVAADSGLARIVVFDAGNTNGVVFADPEGPVLINVTVVE